MEIEAPPAPATVPAAAASGRPAPTRLWNRNFFLLWQGQTISQLGNQAFSIALAFWVKEATGSATLMGLLMTCGAIPGVLLAPFGGTYADRHSRIRIVIVCDVLAGCAVLGLGLALRFLSLPTNTFLTFLFAVAVLGGAQRAYFMPALQAAIPDLVPPDRLASANSLNQFSVQTSVFAGQAVGGVLYRLLGAPLLFIIDGASYLFAAFCELFVADTFRKPEKPAAGGPSPFRAFLSDTGEGLRWVWKRGGMRDFVAVACLLNFIEMPMLVLLPFYVEGKLGAGADWYGFLLAAVSVGSLAGFGLAAVLKLRGLTRAWTLVVGLILGSGTFAATGFTGVRPLALGLSFTSGLAFGFVNIYLVTLLQTSTPPELRGRVLGLLATLGGGLMPLGLALGGWLGDLTGKNIPLIYGGCGILAATVTLLLATRKECLAFLAQEA